MLIPVILSGGTGARLWPVSREAYPKPFIRLFDGKTLLQKTFERAASIDGTECIVTVTNREYFFLTREEYQKCQTASRPVFMLEPCPRNTASAVAMAAMYTLEVYGEDVQILVLPADHLIEDHVTFRRAVEQAQALARSGSLVTFGVTPLRAETGYGYIECGPSAGARGTYRVSRFVEKPSSDRAAQFLAAGNFLWNSGMFCFGARSYMEALEHCAPDLCRGAIECWQATERAAGDKVELNPRTFEKLPDVSVDYAVMEKHREVAVVHAEFSWSDIGSWDALAALLQPDADGNRISGEAITVDARDCYIQSDSRVVAAVGVEGLIVVDTSDALLVTNRGHAQDVKSVVSRLKLAKHAAHEVHRTVHRPWGTYTVLEEGMCHKIKRIVVKPGASLSLQMHHHRSEHWIVISGSAEVVNGEKHYTVVANESTFIPPLCKHRLANLGMEDLIIIEVQTGDYVGEDDIVRFEDVYGRVPSSAPAH